MGRAILELAAADPGRFQVAGAVDRPGHPDLGRDLSAFIPGLPAGHLLAAAPPAAPPPGGGAVDFSSAAAIAATLDWAERTATAVVIGTTGLDVAQRALLQAAAGRIPVLLTPNTSTGINVLFWLAHEAARLLGPEYDVEIVEMHHHHKRDAPSGTARRLAERILEARGGDWARDVRHGREGLVGPRVPGEVGMHALRGGDVAGDHTVIFAGPGERIELTHRAHGRATLAQGALRAAEWLRGRAPGLYSMNDVLGL